MSGSLFRWSLALSWRSGASGLARSIALTLLTACLAFVMAGTIALHQSTQLAQSRQQTRAVQTIGSVQDGQFDTFESATSGEAAREDADFVFNSWIWSITDGRSLPLVVLEPSEGIASFAGIDPAKPGWYVSDGVLSFLDANPTYANMFGEARLIDQQALQSPEEILAIQVLPAGESLRDGTAGVIHTSAVRADDFNQPTVLGTYDRQLGPAVETMAVMIVVGLCTVLLWSALNLAMTALRSRERVLRRIGASETQVRLLRFTTACAVAVPGLALGLGLWQSVADRFGTRPVDSQAVFAGDLTLSGPALLVATALMLAVVLIASIAHGGASAKDLSRSAARPPRLTRLSWFAPAAIATGIAVRLDAGSDQDMLLAVALIAFVAALWINVPLVLSATGKSLARFGRDRAALLLAGRRLQHDAFSTGRALGFIAVLALVLPLIGPWFGANSAREPVVNEAPDAYDIGPAGLPGDYERFASIANLRQTPLPLIFAPSTQTGANGSRPQPVMLAPGDCGDWADASANSRCDNGTTLVGAAAGPISFVGDGLSLTEAEAAATNYLVRYDQPHQRSAIHREASLLNTDRLAQRALGEIDSGALYLPGFAAVSSYEDPAYQRNVAWIKTVAIGLLSAGAIVALLFVAVRSRRTGTDRTRLGAFGATQRRIQTVAFIETATAMLVVSLVGVAAAAIVLTNLRIVNPTIPLPNARLVTLEALSLLTLSLVAAVTAAAAVRDPATLWHEQNTSIQS